LPIIIQQNFIAKNKHDKKRYPKLILNILKVMGNFIFIYTPWVLSSNLFLRGFQSTCDPYVHPCVPMCEL